MGKVLWLIKCVKSGLQSFVLDISQWPMLHSQVGQVKLIAINWRYEMRIVNAIPHRREPEYSKYPNQALKVLCTSLVMFTVLMFGFHISKENLLDQISTCDSQLKRSENVPFLKQIMTGDEKCILYNNVEQKRSWSKWNEPSPTTSVAALHPKKVMLCIWWDQKGVLYLWAPSGQPNA